MENCINCTHIEEFASSERPSNSIINRIKSFLTTFRVEGAEYLSKTK